MSLPAIFDKLRLPVIAAPLFIISHPALVIAQCQAGVVGSFPALNARPHGCDVMADHIEALHRARETSLSRMERPNF